MEVSNYSLPKANDLSLLQIPVQTSQSEAHCIAKLFKYWLIQLIEIQHECYIPADPLASLAWLGCSVANLKGLKVNIFELYSYESGTNTFKV